MHTQQFVTSGSAPAEMSILVLAACVVGGIGRVSGPVVGGVIVFGFSTLIPGLQNYDEVAFGILIILVMILRPGGLVGLARPRTALSAPALSPQNADDTDATRRSARRLCRRKPIRDSSCGERCRLAA